MGKVKWILICGALMAALSVNVAAAGPKADTNVFFDMHGTTGWSATMATLVMTAGAGALDTAISVSNTCATPDGDGFPMCGVGPDGMSGDVGAVPGPVGDRTRSRRGSGCACGARRRPGRQRRQRRHRER